MDAVIDLTGASRLGVIADTHGLVRPELYKILNGVDALLHAGDVGGQEVEISLTPIAPVHAVAGNVDGFERSPYPRRLLLRVGGHRIGLTHVALQGARDLVASVRTWCREERINVLIFGHTHEPLIERHSSGVLLFNPGSCGPRRFKLPIAVGVLHIGADRQLRPEILEI